MLLKKQDPSVIAKKLLKQKTLMKSQEDFLGICRFMHQAGLNKMIIQLAIDHLKTENIVPWAFVISILDNCGLSVSKKVKLMCFDGIIEQNQLSSVLTCCHWDKIHPEWVKMKLDEISEINRKKNSQFIQLMEDLEFIKSQGLLKKEEEILKKLKKLAPNNPNINEKWVQFRERWGRHIIQKKKQTTLKSTPFYANSEAMDPEELKQMENIVQSVRDLVVKQPDTKYNMALMLFFIGYPKFASQILKDHLHFSAAKWLYADLLLQSKLYLNCLSFLDSMEKEEGHQPEVVFALTYMRAKAYYGLGKKKKGKDILTELLKVKPNYRLAHYLLEQWKKEDEVL